MQDEEDYYDWYTFPRAMEYLLDLASRLALQTVGHTLSGAAAANRVPTKWRKFEGGIFGQELFEGVKLEAEPSSSGHADLSDMDEEARVAYLAEVEAYDQMMATGGDSNICPTAMDTAEEERSDGNEPFSAGSTECISVVIIGASTSGLGVASALLSASPDLNVCILEASDEVGSSFRNWPPFTRFISPSFYSNPFGCLDLNQVTPDDNGVQATQGQKQHEHPTGKEYANYLNNLSHTSEFGSKPLRGRVAFGSYVTSIEKFEHGARDAFKISTADGKERNARYVIYAGGEYMHPYEPTELTR